MQNYSESKFSYLTFIFLILLSFHLASAKNTDDIVILKNGDRLTGELKSLQRGELKFKADYMAEAVRLDWSQVQSIESKSTFLISLVDGKLFTDVLRLVPSNSPTLANFVIGSAREAVRVQQLEVLRILPADARFWSRLEGSIDFGLSYTSGNEQYQTDLSATATYRKGDNSYTASGESSFSGQPQGTSTKRNQFVFDYRKQLNEHWYGGGLLEFLRSDQQSLDLRTSVGGLVGRNLVRSESTLFSVFGGVVGTRERYTAELEKPHTTNADAMAGVDFATFKFNRTDLRSRFSLFPSLTTPGRTRLQLTSNVKFKIVKDLWWGFNVYENYDSKPPVRADKNDLGISTSLSWKF